jgi:predicted nucleic acid-binding protein
MAAGGNHIGVSAIRVAEMVDQDVPTNMAAIPREEVPDLPDRVTAATAHLYGIPVLARDGRIRSSNVRAIW